MLTEQQKQKFEAIRQTAREEMEELDKDINAILAKVKGELIKFQQYKKALKQISDGACAILGINSDLKLTDIDISELIKHDQVNRPQY